MTTASVYVRISLDRTGQELGIERQEQECREMCARMGWEVGDVFADNDLSATSGVVRPAFERLLESSPEVVVCWHSDRFIRLMSDLERVIDLSVNVHAVHVGTLDLSTPSGRMVARIVTSVAQHEGEQRSLRQRVANRQKAARGKPSWVRNPIGYSTSGAVIPKEAAAVRQAYAAVLDGKSLYSLAQRWNAEGPAPRRGGTWTGANVRRLLLSPRNAAISTYYGEELGEGDWEPLVDVDTFRAVSALLSTDGRWVHGRNKTGRKPSSMLAALAICGVCGAAVRTQRHASRGDAYVCGGAGHVYAPLEQVDGLVLISIVDALKADDVARHWQERAGVDDERQGWLSRSALLRARQEGAAHAYAQGALTLAQLTMITEDLTGELASLEEHLAAWRPAYVAADLLADLDAVWERLAEMPLDDLRQLVSEVCTEVRIMPREGRRVPLAWRHVKVRVRGNPG